MDYGRRHSSIAINTLDLLALDPFAEDVTTVAQAVSLGDDKRRQRGNSSLRRQSLETRDEISIVAEKWTRSCTEVDTRANGSALHPLRSAGLAPGPSDAGVTRPHLSRILDVGTLVDAPPVEADDTPDTPVEEKDVLVHEVRHISLGFSSRIMPMQITPGDSLAGVSLKYGISMAELRRANQLWASDSIHLRTELYIPVDKASRLKPIPVDNLITITPAEEIPDPMDTSNHHAEDFQATRRPSDTETIRRVPASQLSFFPPSSVNKAALQPRSSQDHTPSRPTPASVSHPIRYASHPSNSLTSLLTSLPIPAATRDAIITRLSFDSDREEEHDLHELDDVRHAQSTSAHTIHPETEHSYPLLTPKAVHRDPRVEEPPERSYVHIGQLSGSPKSYIPPHTQIRTVQMEPSPTMQLPRLKGVSSLSIGKRKTGGSLLDVDFELGSTGGAA
ncbi:hypothetical protein DXG03_004082 [Asterophora parasitica]|uniref:LysM domain-containing protein n=1 Tax=Asterophora parasitica TaxID=117018 RepID=A0A9P7GFA0_9AGAR|nr:hypothetical protein DXG03_004082 [Asterophora parasitica]